jgi:phospholipid transport system substrate-binding protein
MTHRLALASLAGVRGQPDWTKVQVGGREADGYPGLVRADSPRGAEEAQTVRGAQGSVTRALLIAQSQGDDAQRRVELREVGEALFDFHEMGRRALGQHWAGRTPQEQEEFVRLFTDLLERSYLLAIGSRGAGTVTFQDESVEGSSARVRSRLVTDRGAEIPIEFRLLERRGRWAVYDLVVEGVSLISSYRSQFNSIMRNSSFVRLLAKLAGRETP